MGNRNPGTLNVGVNLGRGWGILVALLDALKSFVSMLVMRRQDAKWVRWVPISLVFIVPVLAAALNALFDLRLFEVVSLGGHPWYRIAGVWAVCFLMLGINVRYLRKRLGGAVTDAGGVNAKRGPGPP